MSSKSRRGRSKRSSQFKKKKSGLSPAAVTAQKSITTAASEPVVAAGLAASAKHTPATMPKTAAVSYPFITTELRRIGILAGIMLVVLVVLAVVLS